MISIDGLAVEFSGTTLFSDISFVINEKDRIALMGKNGAGKSTLLKILAGVRQPTRGKVSAPKDCVVAYLPQHLMTEDGRTVFDETAQAFAHLHEMEAQIDRLNKELETRTDYESDSYMALIEEVSSLSEKYYSIDATNYEEDVEKALLGLGFRREAFGRQTSDFSGGWRMRIELAKLLLQKPDVLLLDLAPGTGDMAISVAQALPNAELVVVTTPQPSASDVAVRSGLVALQVPMKVRGVVENMSWYEHKGERLEIFGAGGGRRVSDQLTETLGYDVPLLAQLPLDPDLREVGESGRPAVLNEDGALRSDALGRTFRELAEGLLRSE